MQTNFLSETLRNYASREDTDVVFRCVLLEAAERLERSESERENYEQEVRYLHGSLSVKQTY